MIYFQDVLINNSLQYSQFHRGTPGGWKIVVEVLATSVSLNTNCKQFQNDERIEKGQHSYLIFS